MRTRVGAVRYLLLSAFAFVGCRASEPRPSVTFLSVGQGDCTILQQGDEAILIDAGPKVGSFDAGERIVRKRLRERGVARLRGILLTHDDSDHVGGAAALLRAFPGAVAWAGPKSRIPASPRVQRLEEAGKITFGSFHVTWQFPAGADDDNSRSVLTSVRAEGLRLVLTGDAPTGIEEEVLRLTEGTIDVYKAGHHGSKNSSSEELLSALKPRFVVVSCGAGNRYGHPHPDALARFRAVGAKTLRTDREGDIEFRWDGKSWAVRTTPLDPVLSRGR